MHYLVSVIREATEADKPADQNAIDDAEQAAVDDFNADLKTNGHWVFAGGLGTPESATVIDNRGTQALFTDGPFLESKEYLIGFWVIEARDLDVALKLACAGSKACNRKVEVRPFL
ncbi:YciI family protein [Nocardia sp. NPDC005978]|uniref:YciI family protein n=1 Tax=Nocardia sp. NPDC005978 TaxID=3156725 RepID=UPI0033A09439